MLRVVFPLGPRRSAAALRIAGGMGSVRSVNVSAIRTVEIAGNPVTTGIYKEPAAGSIALRGVNLAGDDQADRDAHGGPQRAVYAYASEDSAWWEAERGAPFPPGVFGENLTLAGIDVSGALVGETWRVGTALLQVTSPRVPCFKLAHKIGDPRFVKTFAQALRPGAYLRVLDEGAIAAGDAAEIVHRPNHDLSVAEMARLYFFDRANIKKMLVADDLPDSWREWVLGPGSL